MLFESVYNSLEKLDPDEQLGYDYYRQTGRLLTYSELCYLTSLENPYDFSKLKTDFKKQFKKKYNNDVSNVVADRDVIPPGRSLVIKKLPRYAYVGRHKQEFVEISCVLKGTCVHEINGKKIELKTGSVVIIPPNVEHDNIVTPDCILIAMGIKVDKFDKTFKTLMSKGTMLSAYFANTLYSSSADNTLLFNYGDDTFIPRLLLYIYEQKQKNVERYNAVVDGAFLTFITYLLQNFEDTVEFFDNESASTKQMVLIEQYIRQNFKTATLSGTAEHFFLTPTYLSARIKEKTGYTFSHIIRSLRMERATEPLLHTDMNLEQICESIGYTDVTQFIKSFKKVYNTTPNKYRKENK